MAESSQKWIQKNRKPRTHILMEVETEGAMEKKELPFVIGVMGDFAGDQDPKNVQPLRDRNFIGINKDNFDTVMKKMKPTLTFSVPNKLEKDSKEDLGITLKFEGMKDFDPTRVAEQVPALKKLLEERGRLQDLISAADRDPKIAQYLEKMLAAIKEGSKGETKS